MTSNLKSKVNPLTWNVPIVNKDGTPTNEFMRKWQAQALVNGLIPGQIVTPEQVSAILDILGAGQGDVLYRSAAGWVVLTPGPAGDLLMTGGASANPSWSSISALLDLLGGTQGDTLFRGAAGWEVLAPGTNGQVLTYDTTLHAPKWAAGGGGGGVTIGTGAPTAYAAAGTPYSRDDAAGFYVSTPTSTSGTGLVQHSAVIANASGIGSINLPSAPTPGNLIMVFVNWSNASGTQPTVDTTKWTQFITVNALIGQFAGFAFYRYAQAGDTAALPAVTTSGSNYWSAEAFEVTGVSGTFATDVEYSAGTYVIGNSLTSTSHNTASGGALALVAGGQYNGNTNPSFSAGWTLDDAANNSGFFGSVAGAHQVMGASGSPVQATITTTFSSSYSTVLFQVIVAGSAPVGIPGWTLVGPSSSGGPPATDYWNLDDGGPANWNIDPSYFWLTATTGQASWQMIRGKRGKAVGFGKLYFELAYAAAGNYSVPGFVYGSAALNDYPGSSAGWGQDSAGNVHAAGGGSGSSGSSWAYGDVIGCAIDSAGTIQWYKNNVANGSISGIGAFTGPLFLAMGTNGAILRVKLVTTAADFKYAPPSGYSAWG
jgi:hypothetical protein